MTIAPIWAIRLIFAIPASLLGLWSVRVAEFMGENGLGAEALSYLLLLGPIAITLSLFIGPIVSRKIGFRQMALSGTIAMAIAFTWLSFNPPLWIAAVMFAVFGFAAGILEVGINAIAQHIDRYDRPVMSSAHGFWSIGVMVGGLLAGGLAAIGLDFQMQQIITLPVVIVLAMIAIRNLPIARTGNADDHAFAIPTLAILPFCLIPVGALIIEGTIVEWASPFLQNERGVSAPVVGIVVAAMTVGMAVTRLHGDRLRLRFAPRAVIKVASIITIIGIAFFVASDSILLVTLGALLAGLGAGNIYPYTLILANEGQSDGKAAEIISAIALISFTAFLLAPALMGQIGGRFSLGIAFAAIIPLVASTFLWLRLSRA